MCVGCELMSVCRYHEIIEDTIHSNQESLNPLVLIHVYEIIVAMEGLHNFILIESTDWKNRLNSWLVR